MKTKRGISLVVLVITIIIMIMIASIVIIQINNTIFEAEESEFVVELSTIKDKVKEYYMLTGMLPVDAGTEYTAGELIANHTDSVLQGLLESEITANKDTQNTFFVVDLDLMKIKTDKRGKKQDKTDIFIVASNTLNIYYLKGFELYDIVRFSTVTLVPSNEVEGELEQTDTEVVLKNQLDITKNTSLWTKEIVITVKNNLNDNETLQYFFSGGEVKQVPDNNIIVINSDNMSEAEKTSFTTNKYIILRKLLNSSVAETKTISIDNLDITIPTLGTLEMTDTSNEEYNVIKINSVDQGGSGVKCLYYDYSTMLVNDLVTSYYSDRSEVTVNDLISFGKITNDGVIRLDKNIKSIVAIARDNAGNVSNITTYTIEDTYLTSK